MYNNKIVSLCASVINSQGKDMLFRIADLSESNELVPFYFDSSLPRDAENTNSIHPNPWEVQPEGTITFWEWYVQDGTQQRSFLNKDSKLIWIEHIRLEGVYSLEQLRIAMFDGIDVELSSDHDYLIEFSNDSNGISHCIYCKSNDFTLRGGKYVLCDDIYRLDRYEILNNDIHEIRAHFLPKLNKRYYGYRELPQKCGSVLVRTPADTVKRAIQKRIKRCTEGFSKSDKNIISEFIKTLSNDDIVNHIANECRCTMDEAKEYIDEFVKTCERYFAEEDFTSSVLLHLVEYSSDIGKKYQDAVRLEWELENSEQIDCANSELARVKENIETERRKAQEELSIAKKRLDDLFIECEEYEEMRAELESKLSEIKKEYDSKLTIADDITKQVRNKITAAKSDLATFFAEYALFSGEHSVNLTHTAYYCDTVIGKSINENPDTITDLKELLEILDENLEAVGVDKSLCSALSAYILAACFAKIPLIIAGYGADSIINAVSATLYNKDTDIIFVTSNKVVGEKSEYGVVAIHNGFCSMGNIINSLELSHVYFVSQTSEELMLEPRSVYNYALPIFTEYFVTGNSNNKMYGTISNVNYGHNGKELKPFFPKHILPPLAFNNYKKLLGIAKDLYNDITPYEFHLLTTLPVMLSLGKRDDLLELLSTSKLSDKEKGQIYELIGEKQ